MPCMTPYTLKDETVVPCGHCLACLQLKRLDWCTRLKEEQRMCCSSYFLTLTYKVNPVSLNKKDLQDYMKRLRKFQDGLYDGLVPVRYYSVGEYGDVTARPHYHQIIFNLIPETVAKLPELWSHGHVHIGSVTPDSIGYVTSYVIQPRVLNLSVESPFQQCPDAPG